MKQCLTQTSEQFLVCTLYRFIPFAGFESFQIPVREQMVKQEIVGTILLANEGINGVVAGQVDTVRSFLVWLQDIPGLGNIDIRESRSSTVPFKRARVKLKKEIVTMGVEGIDMKKAAGTHVEPEHWNTLIDNPRVLVIDARNDYEIKVGRFNNSVAPHTSSFREFPEFVQNQLDPGRHDKIAMYCTGGIRCEKAAMLLESKGFKEIYQLKGGILKYLELIPEEQSRWHGECFVFDDRVTVDHNLDQGSYDQCHACRRPISLEDKSSEKYISGVSCPYCFDQKSEQDRARYAEREKQTQLAFERGEIHFGPNSQSGQDRSA